MRLFLVSLLLMAAATGGVPSAAAVPEAGPPAGARHGGAVTATAAHAFETVLAADGLRVFLLTDELAPAMIEKAAGSAKLILPDGRMLEVALVRRTPAKGEPITYFCPMHAEVIQDKAGTCKLCGGMVLYEQDHLFGAADLSGLDRSRIEVIVHLAGLRGQEKEVNFSPAFPTPDVKAPATASGN